MRDPEVQRMPVKRRAKVLTVSTGCAAGTREDRSGPALCERLSDLGYDVVEARVVPDGREVVAEAVAGLCRDFSGLVVTTGGTGFAPTDETPEGTLDVLERQAPGIAEAMRLVNPLGRLSRGIAGTCGAALVINLPGSTKGSRECLDAIVDVIPHALELIAGEDPSHPG